MKAEAQVNKDTTCATLKTGTFHYPDIAGAYSIRTEKEQISYMADGRESHFKIKWKSNCEFVLTFKKSNKEGAAFKKGDTITVKIISVDGDCYTYISTVKNMADVKGTMCRGK